MSRLICARDHRRFGAGGVKGVGGPDLDQIAGPRATVNRKCAQPGIIRQGDIQPEAIPHPHPKFTRVHFGERINNPAVGVAVTVIIGGKLVECQLRRRIGVYRQHQPLGGFSTAGVADRDGQLQLLPAEFRRDFINQAVVRAAVAAADLAHQIVLILKQAQGGNAGGIVKGLDLDLQPLPRRHRRAAKRRFDCQIGRFGIGCHRPVRQDRQRPGRALG